MSQVSKLDPVRLMAVLSKIPLFQDLLPEERNEIQEKIKSVECFSEGDIFVKEDAHDPFFYIILSGTADVLQNGRKINEMESGQFIGEMAFICHEPRSASLQATSDITLLPVNVEDMRRFPVRIREAIKDQIITGLVERVGRLNKTTLELEDKIKQLEENNKSTV